MLSMYTRVQKSMDSGMIYRWKNIIFICNEVIIHHHPSHLTSWHFSLYQNLFPFYLGPHLILFLSVIGREYTNMVNGKVLSVRQLNIWKKKWLNFSWTSEPFLWLVKLAFSLYDRPDLNSSEILATIIHGT